jgi:molybdopterin-guanine dinucleotide biosynthesis protein A
VIERSDITGLILCGGTGRRIGGRDKPLLHLAGVPLVEHVRRRLQPQVARVAISCNAHFDAYARYGHATVADALPERGPLGGVLAGLLRSETAYLFVCPGDAPLLSKSLVARLADALQRQRADVALPYDGQRQQHLFALLRRALAPALRAYLDSGATAVRAFIAQQRATVVDAGFERDAFTNVNSLADLAAAAALLQEHAP